MPCVNTSGVSRLTSIDSGVESAGSARWSCPKQGAAASTSAAAARVLAAWCMSFLLPGEIDRRTIAQRERAAIDRATMPAMLASPRKARMKSPRKEHEKRAGGVLGRLGEG